MAPHRLGPAILLMLLALTGCAATDGGQGGIASAFAPFAQKGAAEAGPITLPDGVEWVETVTDTQKGIVIPYSKYRLDNGLTIILHEDHSDPLVHVDVTYHVGSARERPGRSGFAHFFEHMMFQGSVNVADEEHFKIVSEAGGTLNGTTNADRTNYYQTVPANQLEKMLWLESDRMGYLLPAVTRQKFEVQRATVKNERAQRYDNAPYGLVGERVGEAFYPADHPYHWPVIGYTEDLNEATLADLQHFFLRWYGPNNAVLTIGGDLDPEQTLAWVKKYFGGIPRGPKVQTVAPEPIALDQDRYITLDDDVALPLIYIAMPTVHARHPDEPALDVLASILGDGRTSLFYKNLVRDGLAVQAETGHPCRELACQFTLYALPNPAAGVSLADLEQRIRASFDEFEERGVLPDDLARVKAQIRSRLIFGLESVSGKVSQLAFFETFAGTPNYIAQELARYEAVTEEDVMAAYRRYLKDQSAVILSVLPEGQDIAPASAANWQRPAPPQASAPTASLDYRAPVDDFDRRKAPPASQSVSVIPPMIWRDSLDNGIPVIGAINDEVPTTALTLRLNVGQLDEPLTKLGLAALTASMLNESTEGSSNEALSNRLDKLGSQISVSSGNRYSSLTVRSLTENLDETLDIAWERLFTPGFDEADFERVKSQTIEGIRAAKKDPSSVADQVFSLTLYGQDNAFSWSDAGLEETVASLTLDDVRAFYAEFYRAGAASVAVVSDLPRGEVMALLSPLEDWQGDRPPPTPMAAFPRLETGKIYLVDKPGATQSEIRIGRRAMPFDATGRYYRAGLVNYPLGGAFNSRINLNLREDKGYTYGARTGFSGEREFGRFVARAGVRTDVTGPSIREFLDEIHLYADQGPTAEEVSFTRQAIGQSTARDYETPRQKLGFLSLLQTYDLKPSFVEAQKRILDTLTEAEADQLATDLFSEEVTIVVVGDREAIADQLSVFEREIVLLDENGRRVDEGS
ncbi:peptidase, M16 family protein [Parvularcula bermudensis HTCC2503]|uniref:Peptidase, M16 family protein n=1 Tax=Parvularcula bermudensis (strain ATCC BAA-594 / HTCC2503 / KCTC 12087) TaxID=314260 RepID=E0TF94_PARBH|nr:pitrilysin family protein [Parvularcula bermudensis]ADM09012.1 peptidase, M16 family protein [Parvularcula bermudensis HTCC2503]